MVYFLHASDWFYALDATYGVLIKVSLEGMMKRSLKVESQTHQKLKAPRWNEGFTKVELRLSYQASLFLSSARKRG